MDLSINEFISKRNALTDRLYVMTEESRGGFDPNADYKALKKQFNDLQLEIKDIDKILPQDIAQKLDREFKSRITGLLGVRY